MVFTYYIKLLRTGADRHNSILMSLLFLVAETISISCNTPQEKFYSLSFTYGLVVTVVYISIWLGNRYYNSCYWTNMWKKAFLIVRTKSSSNFTVKLTEKSNHSFLLFVWWIIFFKHLYCLISDDGIYRA